MRGQRIPDSHHKDAAPLRGTRASALPPEALMSFPAPIALLDRDADLDPPRWREHSPGQALLDTLGRRKPRQPTGTSLPQFRHDLAQAWRLMPASQIDEALRMIECLELQLDDVPPASARRLRGATQLLRAAGLAFQDDSLTVLPVAVSLLKKGRTTQDDHAALTLCRLGFWRLGGFDSFGMLPRLEPRARWSKSLAISAMLDLSIEARSHSIIYACEAAELATVPACVAAQVLYEDGCVDQADTLLRDRLPVINARGPIEFVLRAYVLLSRIAKQTKQSDFAAQLLRAAEALGERRGWPRVVAACLAERASLLLQGGRTREARLVKAPSTSASPGLWKSHRRRRNRASSASFRSSRSPRAPRRCFERIPSVALTLGRVVRSSARPTHRAALTAELPIPPLSTSAPGNPRPSQRADLTSAAVTAPVFPPKCAMR